MPIPSDYRYNPWDNALDAVQIQELRQVPFESPYHIRLNEVPEKGDPSTMSVREVTGITEGRRNYGNTFTEVAEIPSSGKFRPDYYTGADNDKNWNTGLIQFSASDAGKVVEITYNGMGTIASCKAPSFPSWFLDRGDGNEGDFAPTTNTFITQGIHQYKSLYVPEGITITCEGFCIIKVSGAAIIKGTLSADGKGAKGSTDGAGGNGWAGGAGGKGGMARSEKYWPANEAEADINQKGKQGGVKEYGRDTNMITSSPLYAVQRVMNLSGSGGGAGGGFGSSRDNDSVGIAMGHEKGGNGGGCIYLVAASVGIDGTITANGLTGGDGWYVRDHSHLINVWYGGGGSSGGGGGGGVVLVAGRIRNNGTVSANGGQPGKSTSYGLVGTAGENGIVYIKELGNV